MVLLPLIKTAGFGASRSVTQVAHNGPAMNSWPDGGNTTSGGQKGVGGSEGGFRVPMVVKWPGRIPAGVTTGEFMTMDVTAILYLTRHHP
jgi:arylsulfatase A-like enzyme